MQPRIVLSVLATTALAATALIAAAPAASAGPGDPCTRELLPTLPGSVNTSLNGGDRSDTFQVGVSEQADGSFKLVRWSGGVAQDLGAAVLRPRGINASGEIAGDASAGGVGAAYRLRGGVRTQLPTPASFVSAYTVAINDRGVVAGWAGDADGWNARAVAWSATNQVKVLDTPAGFNEVKATGIDGDGTIIGTALDWDYEGATARASQAVRWNPDGSIDRVLSGFSAATDIRHGMAIAEQDGKSVLWTGYPPYQVTPLSGSASAINSSAAVLRGGHRDQQLVHEYYGTQALPDDSDVMVRARSKVVTDNFKVYGYDYSATTGRERPIRWTCG